MFKKIITEKVLSINKPIPQSNVEDMISHSFLLKNYHRYKGKRCFIIANGPSLNKEDLEKLDNEITFACNKIHLIFPETHWRPNFWMVCDRLVIDYFQENLYEFIQWKNEKTKTIFTLGSHLKRESYLDIMNVVNVWKWGNTKNRDIIQSKMLETPMNFYEFEQEEQMRRLFGVYHFSFNLLKEWITYTSIVIHMLELAIHMGFNKIYIIGLDHQYTIDSKDSIEKGNIISSGSMRNTKNHFHSEYRKKGEKWNFPVVNVLDFNFYQTYNLIHYMNYKKYIDVEIFNASRETQLEWIPKVNLDYLF